MHSYILKKASPKWVELFQNLSPEDQRKILDMRPRERTVRPLGKGSSNVADLVVNPKYGLSVRKLMRIIGADKDLVDVSYEHRKKQLRAEARLKEIAGGRGPFAHLLGVEGIKNRNLEQLGFDEGIPNAKAYYDFAKGDVHPDLKWADRRIAQLDKRLGRGWQWRARHHGLESELEKIENIYRGEQDLGVFGNAVRAKMEDEGYRMWDVRHPNIVGGKVVDFEGIPGHLSLGPKQELEDVYRRRNRTWDGVKFTGTPDLSPNEVRKFWMSNPEGGVSLDAPTSALPSGQKGLLESLKQKHGLRLEQMREQRARNDYGVHAPFRYNTELPSVLPESKPSLGKFFNRAIDSLKSKLKR
jgi:hypothetical protein